MKAKVSTTKDTAAERKTAASSESGRLVRRSRAGMRKYARFLEAREIACSVTEAVIKHA